MLKVLLVRKVKSLLFLILVLTFCGCVQRPIFKAKVMHVYPNSIKMKKPCHKKMTRKCKRLGVGNHP